MNDYGERLKELRKEANITQTQLADALNIHAQTVSKWERGISEPDISELGELAKILGVSLEKLIGAEETGETFVGNFNAASFGEMLSQLRTQKGEERKTLAAALSVSVDTVSKWERGITCPNIEKLVALSQYYGMPASKIWCGIGEEVETETPVQHKRRKRFAFLWSGLAVAAVGTAAALALIFYPRDNSVPARDLTVTVNDASYEVKENDWFSPTIPERKGYDFLGWETKDGENITFPYKVTENLSVQAVYAPHVYQIDYWLNGGVLGASVVNAFTVEDGALTLPEPTSAGNTFLGWYLSPDYSDEPVTSVVCDGENVSLYARWEQTLYSVRYEMHGGVLYGENPETVTTEKEIVLAEPIRRGYLFLGWSDGENGEKIYETVGGAEAKNVTLHALWQKCDTLFSVTYQSDGGVLPEGKTNPVAVGAGEYYTLSAPEKTGYDFLGWSTSDDGSDGYIGALCGVEGNLTLYAVYEAKNILIRYEYKGAYETEQNPNSIRYGESVTLQPVRLYGYDFLGWYTEEEGGEKIERVDVNNILTLSVLYARYAPRTFEIKLKSGEGVFQTPNGAASEYIYKVSFEEKLVLPDCERAGYKFLGWQNAAGERITIVQAPNIADITLTAIWQEIPRVYKVTYHLNGGVLPMGKSNPESVGTGEHYTLVNPEKTGYDFLGWSKSENGSDYITVLYGVEEDLQLYAVYEAKTVLIRYEYEGVYETEPNPNCISFGETVVLNPVYMFGYEFLGWYTSKINGTKIEKVDEENIFSLSVLYARYQARKYNISLDAGEGTFASPDGNVGAYTYILAFDETLTLPDCERTGYKFLGWQNAAGERITIVQAPNIDDMTLTAIWQEIPRVYKVTYHLNGGVLPMGKSNPESVGTGEHYTLVNPEKTGYDFLGWSKSENGSDYITVLYGVEEDLRLYAVYEAKTVLIRYEYEGVYETEPNPNYIAYGESVTLNPVFLYGYEFLGWYTGKINGKKIERIDESNLLSLSVLYARYRVRTFTIRLDAGEGTFASPDGEVGAYTYTVAFEDTFTLPDGKRLGYDFLGWKDENGEEVKTLNALNLADMTLTAVWRETNKTYTIIYELDGGVQASENPEEARCDTSVPLYEPRKDGYSFLGWNDRADGMGKMYLFTPTDREETLVLYAIWQEIKVNGSSEYFTYEKGAESVTITGYIGEYGENVDLVIPAVIEGLPVTEIKKVRRPNEPSVDSKRLRSLTIPEGIVVLGEEAFCEWVIQKPLIIPSSVREIGEECFYQSELTLEFSENSKLTQIGTRAFGGAYFHGAVALPEGLTDIGIEAFSGAGMQGIILPNTLKRIENKGLYLTASKGGEELEGIHRGIYIPASVEFIGVDGVSCRGRIDLARSQEETSGFSPLWLYYIMKRYTYYGVPERTVTLRDGEKETVLRGNAFELPVPEKPGYTFLCWQVDDGEIAGEYLMPKRDCVLTAKYEPIHARDGRAKDRAAILSENTVYEFDMPFETELYFAVETESQTNVRIVAEWTTREDYGSYSSKICFVDGNGKTKYISGNISGGQAVFEETYAPGSVWKLCPIKGAVPIKVKIVVVAL